MPPISTRQEARAGCGAHVVTLQPWWWTLVLFSTCLSVCLSVCANKPDSGSGHISCSVDYHVSGCEYCVKWLYVCSAESAESLPVLSNIEPPAIRRKAATDKLVEKIVKHDSWPIQPDILNPPLLRLTSMKPLWMDLQPVDIKSRWRLTESRLRWSILT